MFVQQHSLESLGKGAGAVIRHHEAEAQSPKLWKSCVTLNTNTHLFGDAGFMMSYTVKALSLLGRTFGRTRRSGCGRPRSGTGRQSTARRPQSNFPKSEAPRKFWDWFIGSSSGCFHRLGLPFVGVLTSRALVIEVCIRAPLSFF